MSVVERPLSRRIMDKFTVDDGCWLWHAGLNDAGYGQINSGGSRGRPLRAHRVLYELLVGPIPDGLVIDHLCRNRACVNPSHMEPVTRGENVRRGVGGELSRQRLASQTHCKRGHEFTPENTHIGRLTSGYPCRVCRTCRRDKARAARRVTP